MNKIRFNSDFDYAFCIPENFKEFNPRLRNRINQIRSKYILSDAFKPEEVKKAYEEWKEKYPEVYEADKETRRSGKRLRNIKTVVKEVAEAIPVQEKEELYEMPEIIIEDREPYDPRPKKRNEADEGVAKRRNEGLEESEADESNDSSKTVLTLGALCVVGFIVYVKFIKKELVKKPVKEEPVIIKVVGLK